MTTSQATLAHANRVHSLLVASGNQTAADRLAAEAERWNASVTNVVVVGDIKRGKSSLVNALVDRPGLLPVDADVATSVHLVVRHGAPERISVTRTDEQGTQTTEEIGPDQLVDVASMAGAETSRQGVGAVDVAIDHPLLAQGLTIVDTPGVGGMTRGHRDITMAALQRADVLVFVVSVQEPVSRTELEFLAEASQRIGNVVLAATRADLATAEVNETMVTDTQQRLRALSAELERTADTDENDSRSATATAARRLARLAERPIVLTSSYLAEQASRRYERGRLDAAFELRERSGIDALAAHLTQATESREHIRLANLLQLTSSLLADLEDEQTTRLRALAGDSSVEDELRERSEQLERAASQQARWRSSLATSISRLQTGAGREVSRELNLVRDHYRDEIERFEGEDLTPLIGQLQQSLQAAWVNLADGVVHQFDGVIASLLADLEIDADEAGLLGDLQQPPGVRAMGHRSGEGGQFDVLEDGLPLATQTFMFGNIANAVVGVLGIATGGLGVMAYGVGIALSAPVVMMRRKSREKRRAAMDLQRELGEALFGQEGISREFTTELSLRILDARERLEALIDERLTTRRRELEQRRRELQTLLKSEVSARKQAEADAERASGELGTARLETDRLRTLVDTELEAILTQTHDHDAGRDRPDSTPKMENRT